MTGYEDDIFRVISYLHIQGSKIGGKIYQFCVKSKLKVKLGGVHGVRFHQLGPLGRVGLVVAMSVCLFTCLSPSHAIFLRGRTSAERASFVDWCDLDLE